MSRGSWPSLVSAIGCRPLFSPTSRGSSPRGPRPARGDLAPSRSAVFGDTGRTRCLDLPPHLGEHPMTLSTFSVTGAPGSIVGDATYQPGVCNIGPAEIARRRRAGHVGLIATIGVLAALVAIGAPPIARLVIAVPAAVSASGYIQARLRFCAGFGSLGVFNFGDVGPTTAVEDPEARRRDRARSRQIGFASGAIGLAVGVAAVLLPV